MTMSIRQCYQLLGLPEGSSKAAVRSAYQRLAQAFHPDRNPSSGDVFSQISAAYQTLCQHLDGVVDIPESVTTSQQQADANRELRRGRRGTPGDRRFEIVLESSYLGTKLRERI